MSDNIPWGFVVAIAPFILGAVLLWAMLRNKQSRRDIGRTEAETRHLREEIDREDGKAERF